MRVLEVPPRARHKILSERQLIANRQNGKKGGVKTEQGKDVSSRNSIRHGILSEHVFVDSRIDPGGRQQFEEFRRQLFEDMQPVGTLEEILVDRLFSAFWRLKRFHIAEQGMIQKQVESHFIEYTLSKIEDYSKARSQSGQTFFQRLRTCAGCNAMASSMKIVIDALEIGGLPLPEYIVENLERDLGGREGFTQTETICISDFAVRNRSEKPISDEDVQELTASSVQIAQSLHRYFQVTASLLEECEERERDADLKTKMIPPLDQLEKLQRYDSHLQRLLLQTLHEIQRMQSARLGRPAPLVAALDMTMDFENGFVR